MNLRAMARRILPARLQDGCRELLDFVVPARRRVSSGRRQAALNAELKASRLSPTGKVLDGIFAGMALPASGAWGGCLARLAGSYEEELTPYLRQLASARPRVVIDIGAADGYYAIGLALMLPSARVYAYEIDPEARHLCRRAAEDNDVANVAVRGRITPNELRRRVGSDTFILCDVEGYEDALLDPILIPSLFQASMVVELHEFVVPGVTRTMTERFKESHHIDLVDAVTKSGAGRPSLAHLPAAEAAEVVDEGRPSNPRMQWMVLIPRRTEGTQRVTEAPVDGTAQANE
jgi:hypothetical protein